jgi:hypothetical protein
VAGSAEGLKVFPRVTSRETLHTGGKPFTVTRVFLEPLPHDRVLLAFGVAAVAHGEQPKGLGGELEIFVGKVYAAHHRRESWQPKSRLANYCISAFRSEIARERVNSAASVHLTSATEASAGVVSTNAPLRCFRTQPMCAARLLLSRHFRAEETQRPTR